MKNPGALCTRRYNRNEEITQFKNEAMQPLSSSIDLQMEMKSCEM